MKQTLFVILGGATSGIWQALTNAIADNNWLVKVVLGAIIGTAISILINEIYKGIKRLLNKENGTIRKKRERRWRRRKKCI